MYGLACQPGRLLVMALFGSPSLDWHISIVSDASAAGGMAREVAQIPTASKCPGQIGDQSVDQRKAEAKLSPLDKLTHTPPLRRVS